MLPTKHLRITTQTVHAVKTTESLKLFSLQHTQADVSFKTCLQEELFSTVTKIDTYVVLYSFDNTQRQ